jgi:hypothetical protein
MLTKWGITNFKSIYNADLDLAPLTVLTGTNSSGKSSFIQSILMVAQTLQNQFPERALILNGSLTELGKLEQVLSFDLKDNNKSLKILFQLIPENSSFKKLDFNLKFKNLVLACEEARKKFSAKLIFGKEIKKENIEKDLFPVAGPPAKIYHYLQTLYKVSEIIINKNINFDDTANFSLVEMLNSHGLLCSPDDEKYTVNKCQLRKFENKSGQKVLFNIHLKPATYSNKVIKDEDNGNYTLASKETVRIYLDWDKDKKQICIGWIGKHPDSCGNCTELSCRGHYRNRRG